MHIATESGLILSQELWRNYTFLGQVLCQKIFFGQWFVRKSGHPFHKYVSTPLFLHGMVVEHSSPHQDEIQATISVDMDKKPHIFAYCRVSSIINRNSIYRKYCN